MRVVLMQVRVVVAIHFGRTSMERRVIKSWTQVFMPMSVTIIGIESL